jgi:hypothetical protein
VLTIKLMFDSLLRSCPTASEKPKAASGPLAVVWWRVEALEPHPKTAVAPSQADPQLGRHRVGCGNLTEITDTMLADTEKVVMLAANAASGGAIIHRWQVMIGGSARQLERGHLKHVCASNDG